MKIPLRAVSFAVLFISSASLWAKSQKPNIVLIMADDIGQGDISCYWDGNSKKKFSVDTPNIDKLAADGMRFTDAHAPASLCAPTRFSMLTGNYSYRNYRSFGVWTPDSDSGIDPKFTTSARIAKAGGYHTAFFGKWGLGSSMQSRKKPSPELSEGALHFGFDYAFELPQGIQNTPFAFYENQKWVPLQEDSTLKHLEVGQIRYPDDKKGKTYEGLGDSHWDPSLAGPMLANKAVSYIDRQTSEHADEPFFIYYCSQAVHLPHSPPAELDGVKIAGVTGSNLTDMVLELDVQVGMIINALKKAGVYENTLFMFTSDNGGLSASPTHDSSNGLSGKKGSISEGGHRVPFIAVWPGVIEPNSVSDTSIVGLDTVATIASLAEQEVDRSKVIDSLNLVPIFKSEKPEQQHAYLMHQSSGGPTFALREGPWKLIMGKKLKKGEKKSGKDAPLEELDFTPLALFNLDSNLAEEESGNLLGNPEQAERIKRMQAKYIELRKTGATTLGK
ncbi:arylsulfatase [Luteolibacter algae]|uniref:Arylsulfatase n=1 Tax=Luteolibacter algae TaxID=454151 RepID=A0ABW5DAJ8_9BACT